ncbi:hypothetical protein Mesil_0450 [Allomeiothermus silvanus DSM 9946]|uniref:DUF304 domain-containing protein n=2 Tax=Allomeiothermus silvanus TaxID=52022 RepID=D7B9V6_ALLS1|nr:hypothetical protein Mesil_0450 [Allomeiothermus silvanus DSM 9946]
MAAGSSMVLMGLLVVGYSLAGGLQGFQLLAVPVILGLFMIALGVDEGFLAELEVTPTQVRIKKWGSWEEFSLEGIEVVDVLRDWLGLGGLILVLAAKGRPSVQINLRQYSNRKELARRILQGVWAANREVLILPRAERRFGRPPY